MKLVLLFCLLPTASAFGKISLGELYLHENAGWCMSDLDETPCSFDCDASYSMDDYDIAKMCYEACIKDFPDEMIENVEYYPGGGGCYCQTSCPSMECGSSTATLSENYDLPNCDFSYDYSYSYGDDGDEYACASTCFEGGEFSVELLCENYTTCATTCDDDSFASYDDIASYCENEFSGARRLEHDECACDDRRRLDASPKLNARQTKKNFKRIMKSISDSQK